MGRSRRIYFEREFYEVVPRAREGLPFPPTMTTNELLLGVMARSQRDQKVELANYVWMTNHAHLHVTTTEKVEMLPCFYGELQKKATEAVKKLLGKRSLSLWEGRPSVMLVADLEAAIERLVYLFANPATAGLCDSIEHYPGLSSWEAFCLCTPCLDAQVEHEVHWYPASTIPSLAALSSSSSSSSFSLRGEKDRQVVELLGRAKKRVSHRLVIKPFAWLAPFGISCPEQIDQIRLQVIKRVKEKEALLRAQRQNAQRPPALSAPQLRATPYMAPHTPKKKERNIFLLCSNRQQRLHLLSLFKSLFCQCTDAYEQVKKGISNVIWPKGAFIPWLPPPLPASRRSQEFCIFTS